MSKIIKLPKAKPIKFSCIVKLEGCSKSPEVYELKAAKFKGRDDALDYFGKIVKAVQAAIGKPLS